MEEGNTSTSEQDLTALKQSYRRKKLTRAIMPERVPEVMDIKELAGYLGIGKSKIYALIRSKKIPASRIGRQYRFHKALIDRWLQEKSISGGDGILPLFSEQEGGDTNGRKAG